MYQPNLLAVLVAALVAFILSWGWYAQPVFGKLWVRSMEKKMDQPDMTSFMLRMGIATLVMSYLLAHFVHVSAVANDTGGWVHGMLVAVAAWIGFVLTTYYMTVVAEQRNRMPFWISAGNYLLMLLVMGAIIGAWN